MSFLAETVEPPFQAFNFEVVLTLVEPVAGVGDPVCKAAFSECDGLQIELEPKTVIQGGATEAVTHLAGQTRAGQLTLRRGMTASPDLWAWMAAAAVPGQDVSADGQVVVRGPDGEVQATFLLRGCLPVRVRGPALNAMTGQIAIEELGLAVGHLALAGADAGFGGGIGIGLSAGISVSAGASVGAAAGGGLVAGATAGAQVSGGLGLSGQLGGTVSGSASAGAGFGAGVG
jgi:phage tail-like protein